MSYCSNFYSTFHATVVFLKREGCGPHSCKGHLLPLKGKGRGKRAEQLSKSCCCQGMGALFSASPARLHQGLGSPGEVCRLLWQGYLWLEKRESFRCDSSRSLTSASIPLRMHQAGVSRRCSLSSAPGQCWREGAPPACTSWVHMRSLTSTSARGWRGWMLPVPASWQLSGERCLSEDRGLCSCTGWHARGSAIPHHQDGAEGRDCLWVEQGQGIPDAPHLGPPGSRGASYSNHDPCEKKWS